MFDLNVLRLGALFNFYVLKRVCKEKVCKCKRWPKIFQSYGPENLD